MNLKDTNLKIYGRGINSKVIEGEIVKTKYMFSLDFIENEKGIYIEPYHELKNMKIKNKIILCKGLKGSSVVTHKLSVCKNKNNAPLGFVMKVMNNIAIHSLFITKIPGLFVVDDFCKLNCLISGDRVILDTKRGIMEVIGKT